MEAAHLEIFSKLFLVKCQEEFGATPPYKIVSSCFLPALSATNVCNYFELQKRLGETLLLINLEHIFRSLKLALEM